MFQALRNSNPFIDGNDRVTNQRAIHEETLSFLKKAAISPEIDSKDKD